jgi:hypothetical protein
LNKPGILRPFIVIAVYAAMIMPVPSATAPNQRLLRVPVYARTEGAPCDVKSFRVVLNRKAARIARVLTPVDAQMILVVLDLVGDLGPIELARQALADALEKLPPTTYVGLLRAQDGMQVLLDPTPDRAPVVHAIQQMTISGRPGLLETLERVQRMADSIARKAQVRVSVLYVTDSNVAEYREDFTNPVINSSDPHDLSRRFPETLIQERMSKMQESFAGLETSLHIVHLTYRGDRLNQAYQNGLKQTAETLAGSAVFCRSLAEIPAAIETVVTTIAGEYTLILDLPAHSPKTVQLLISAGDVPLIYRRRLELEEQ